MSEVACNKETYLSWGTDEDGRWSVDIECDGMPVCGFRMVLEEGPEAESYGLVASEIAYHDEMHKSGAWRAK